MEAISGAGARLIYNERVSFVFSDYDGGRCGRSGLSMSAEKFAR